MLCVWLTKKTAEWKEVGPFPRKGHIIIQQNVKADFRVKRDFLLEIESVWNKFKSINTRLSSSIFRRLNTKKDCKSLKTNLGNGQKIYEILRQRAKMFFHKYESFDVCTYAQVFELEIIFNINLCLLLFLRLVSSPCPLK